MTAPAFLETSPSVLLPEMISEVETALDKVLYSAQLERLLINVAAYRESLVRQDIQRTAEQLLVDFAEGQALEALGRRVGVSRLAASRSTTTLRLTLPSVSGADAVFAAGWGVIGPGNQVFRLVSSAVIPAGQLSVNASAQAETAGSAADGIPAGGGWSALEGTVTVASTVASSGGAEIEDDEALRERILAAPAQFSCASSGPAIEYLVRSVSPDIIDVTEDSPSPGVAGVYVLTRDGLPSQSILDLVSATLTNYKVRMICDEVLVSSPTRVAWACDATLTLYASADVASALASAQAALNAYAEGRRAKLGRDLIDTDIICALKVSGVSKVTLNGWTDRLCLPSEWADATSLTLHIASDRADG